MGRLGFWVRFVAPDLIDSRKMSTNKQPEPWLRGPLPGISPLVANLFYSFEQAREELGEVLNGLSLEEIWTRPHDLAPVGFHVRHMGGATERLGSYLKGDGLTAEQLADLKREGEAGATGAELIEELRKRQKDLERYVSAMKPGEFEEPREVGRAKLPSTAIGLIVHIAEHSQRHLGQAITTAKLVTRMRESGKGW